MDGKMLLYEYLKKYNIKVRDFALQYGIPVSTLYHMQKRKTAPKYEYAELIKRVTGGLVDWKQ